MATGDTRKLIGLGALLAALTSCQPPAPTILAVLERGTVTFHIRDRALFTDRVFGWNDDEYLVAGLTVERSGETYWQVPPVGQPGGACASTQFFPIAYGDRRCFQKDVAGARTLAPGGPYRLFLRSDEWWSDLVLGAFIVRPEGTINNVRPD